MRLIPQTVQNCLPEERVPRLALKIVIFALYLKLVLLPFLFLVLLLDR